MIWLCNEWMGNKRHWQNAAHIQNVLILWEADITDQSTDAASSAPDMPPPLAVLKYNNQQNIFQQALGDGKTISGNFPDPTYSHFLYLHPKLPSGVAANRAGVIDCNLAWMYRSQTGIWWTLGTELIWFYSIVFLAIWNFYVSIFFFCIWWLCFCSLQSAGGNTDCQPFLTKTDIIPRSFTFKEQVSEQGLHLLFLIDCVEVSHRFCHLLLKMRRINVLSSLPHLYPLGQEVLIH